MCFFFFFVYLILMCATPRPKVTEISLCDALCVFGVLLIISLFAFMSFAHSFDGTYSTIHLHLWTPVESPTSRVCVCVFSIVYFVSFNFQCFLIRFISYYFVYPISSIAFALLVCRRRLFNSSTKVSDLCELCMYACVFGFISMFTIDFCQHLFRFITDEQW